MKRHASVIEREGFGEECRRALFGAGSLSIALGHVTPLHIVQSSSMEALLQNPKSLSLLCLTCITRELLACHRLPSPPLPRTRLGILSPDSISPVGLHAHSPHGYSGAASFVCFCPRGHPAVMRCSTGCLSVCRPSGREGSRCGDLRWGDYGILKVRIVKV